MKETLDNKKLNLSPNNAIKNTDFHLSINVDYEDCIIKNNSTNKIHLYSNNIDNESNGSNNKDEKIFNEIKFENNIESENEYVRHNNDFILFKVFEFDKNYKLNDDIINQIIEILHLSKNIVDKEDEYLIFLKKNIKTFFWNPTYNKIYEECLNLFDINKVNFILDLISEESYSIIKIRIIHSILYKSIELMEINERFLIFVRNLFSSIQFLYKNEEISILKEIINKLYSFNKCQAHDKDQNKKHNYNYKFEIYKKICIKEILTIFDKENFCKIIKCKNAHSLIRMMINFKCFEFFKIFEKYYILPYLDFSKITHYNHNIETNEIIDNNFVEIVKLTSNSNLILLLNSDRGNVVINEILTSYNENVIEYLIKIILHIKNDNFLNKITNLSFLSNSIVDKRFKIYESNIYYKSKNTNYVENEYNSNKSCDGNEDIKNLNLNSNGLINLNNKINKEKKSNKYALPFSFNINNFNFNQNDSYTFTNSEFDNYNYKYQSEEKKMIDEKNEKKDFKTLFEVNAIIFNSKNFNKVNKINKVDEFNEVNKEFKIEKNENIVNIALNENSKNLNTKNEQSDDTH